MISIWSTPRSGSIITSKKLATEFSHSFFNEPVSLYLKNKYSYLDKNMMKLSDTYFSGCFFLDCRFKNFEIEIFKNYSEKPHNFEYKIMRKLSQANSNVLVHHHLTDLKDKYFERLVKLSHKNIYVQRINRKNQLASWAIARSENNWVNFSTPQDSKISDQIVNAAELIEFCSQIKIADKIAAEKKFEVVTFDELNIPNFQYQKMNTNSFDRLCSADQMKILSIVKDHFE